MPNPLARKKSTEQAKNKKSSAPSKPAKRHPLAPFPPKDPKKRNVGVGKGTRCPQGKGNINSKDTGFKDIQSP